MSDLSIEEMRSQVEQMPENELEQLLANLQLQYFDKRVALGHAVSEKEEMRKTVDMVSDNAYYMIAYKELIQRQREKVAAAWRSFDDDAEDYIQRVQNYLEEIYSPRRLSVDKRT